jgi:hypothetical protein
MIDALPEPAVVAEATSEGLVIGEEGGSYEVPWTDVDAAYFCYVERAEMPIISLAIYEGTDDERSLIVCESDPVWDALKAAIIVFLNPYFMFELWEGIIDGAPDHRVLIHSSARHREVRRKRSSRRGAGRYRLN